eukprot:CAMPEP_0118798906 /NCGR_PEP_ID=MMETSP1161-20130426/1231_1 /TAXON_ID=249345 /ORGANISM="Picochlorum oklahomensis, Strain CCMP2329" /LENGTH=492 /DNA_ID=CAMNT_0006726475 /DNA_START=88 /DNA_END=1566 /DNA_ORIENTATION=+
MIKLNGYLHALVALAAIFLSLNNIFLFEKAQHAVADVLKHNEFLKKISEKIPIPRRQDTAVNADSCTCGGNVVDPSMWEQKAACQLEGFVPHCCCSYAAVERMNLNSMKSILQELVQTPFFRYFKTDLYCECPLWPDDGMCSLKDCSVCECESDEVPKPWKEGESCDEVEQESHVDRTILPDIKTKLLEVKDWKGYKNPWMPEENGYEYTYVNLLRNGERYTGYKGEHANRVWKAIYEQKCFEGIHDEDVPDEKRVFYRLISGIHSSITAHIVGDYLIDEATQTWGPNLEMFEARLGNPDVKERVENLYFTYLFVLRAVVKASPILKNVSYDTGYPKEDQHTQKLMTMLVDNKDLRHSCPVPFDEGRLWKGKGADKLKQDLQASFQNITRAMDCVGCEKCKMWGKLQFLGIATSLKILFSSETCSGSPGTNNLILERNEVIALVNLLERLSSSVETVRSLSLRLANPGDHPQGLGAIKDLTHNELPYGWKTH